MTIEYLMLMSVGGLLIMSALMSAPKKAFQDGGSKLAARVETQIATGNGFNPYPGTSSTGAGDAKKVPWVKKD